ncbi:MAG: hypothetical protein GX604_09890 [Actinobacteria bacterium]|nr:hypothetical protein [Actinomycetota bacterium]
MKSSVDSASGSRDARVADRKEKLECESCVVIGAGVSGCACAAVLASRGVATTLVNSALDVTGMPGYGPVLSHVRPEEARAVVAALDALPMEMRCAWLSGSLLCRPELTEVAGLIVDPRAVSLRVKWVLEQYPQLQLRQALVTAVQADGDGGWIIRSAFDDELRASYVVVAVGLSLGGRLTVGMQTLEGGRYGEVASDELLEVLRGLGVKCEVSSLSVGHTECATFTDLPSGSVAMERLDDARRKTTKRSSAAVSADPWFVWLEAVERWGRESAVWERGVSGEERGPAPLLSYSLERNDYVRPSWALSGSTQNEDCGDGARDAVVLYPAGLATAEWATAERATGNSVDWDMPQEAHRSRPGYEVRAYVVRDVDDEGRVSGLDGIWAVGRVAGASSYVESLASGVRAAAAVAAAAGPTTSCLESE